MPLNDLQQIRVRAVVALDEYGNPILPELLTSVPVVSYEPTHEQDPNACAWGLYGVLPDQTETHLADCPTKALADALAAAVQRPQSGGTP